MSEPTHEDSQVVDGSGDNAQVLVDAVDEARLGDPDGGPQPPQTGDAGVDDAVAMLREAVAGSLDGQVAAYDAVHRALQDRLADVEG